MKGIMQSRFSAAIALILLTFTTLAGSMEKDQDLFNQAKVLMFDKKWEEARGIFDRFIQEHSRSNLVPQAHYFKARCLHMQGREAAAIDAYELFLAKYPGEPFLPAEARNAVVDLAVTLAEKGNGQYKDRILSALNDSNKEIRYFAAIRCSRLDDSKIHAAAIPVLHQIVESEKERDLIERAKIALLRLDPQALGRRGESTSASSKSEPRMLHILVTREGQRDPVVELNLPFSFAELAFAAFSSAKKDELKRKGFDVDNVWESLKKLGKTDILTIRDGREIVKIWIE
jgi:tetratricopeptide (TPR) repeat protein